MINKKLAILSASLFLVLILLLLLFFSACSINLSQKTNAASLKSASNETQKGSFETENTSASLKVLAVETFLTDISQNIAGDKIKVKSFMPIGLDPHDFEPSPSDAAKIYQSRVIIINGAGLERYLGKLMENINENQQVIIEASKGLISRTFPDIDPHFWLDPNNVIKYVENIETGLGKIDSNNTSLYDINSTQYIEKLKGLDRWIRKQVELIPENQRILVTNHESLGYFADRYGFKIIGTIIASPDTNSSPSPKQVAQLIDKIKETGVKAIFLETGSNPQIAEQVAGETGIKVLLNLYTHSISEKNGPAPDYISMIKYDVSTIVNALSAK